MMIVGYIACMYIISMTIDRATCKTEERATHDDRNEACLICNREYHEIFSDRHDIDKVHFLVLHHQKCDERELRSQTSDQDPILTKNRIFGLTHTAQYITPDSARIARTVPAPTDLLCTCSRYLETSCLCLLRGGQTYQSLEHRFGDSADVPCLVYHQGRRN